MHCLGNGQEGAKNIFGRKDSGHRNQSNKVSIHKHHKFLSMLSPFLTFFDHIWAGFGPLGRGQGGAKTIFGGRDSTHKYQSRMISTNIMVFEHAIISFDIFENILA